MLSNIFKFAKQHLQISQLNLKGAKVQWILLRAVYICEISFRGWAKKKCTNVLLHTTKMIDPRVKSQARGQNNGSRALKWGIVHLCNLNGFRDMIKNKICNFIEFSHFLQFSIAIFTFFYKNARFEKLKFL